MNNIKELKDEDLKNITGGFSQNDIDYIIAEINDVQAYIVNRGIYNYVVSQLDQVIDFIKTGAISVAKNSITALIDEISDDDIKHRVRDIYDGLCSCFW